MQRNQEKTLWFLNAYKLEAVDRTWHCFHITILLFSVTINMLNVCDLQNHCFQQNNSQSERARRNYSRR